MTKLPKDKVRVGADLHLSNQQYIEKYRKESDRRHLLKQKLFSNFINVMRPVPVEDRPLIHQSFNQVINLLYPMVPIDKEEEDS